MKTFIVSLHSDRSPHPGRTTVAAHYYRHEDGWLVFKDESHAIVKEFRDADVLSITLVDKGTNQINLCEIGLHSGPFSIRTNVDGQSVVAACCERGW